MTADDEPSETATIPAEAEDATMDAVIRQHPAFAWNGDDHTSLLMYWRRQAS